jgi:hypothetical protein
MSLLVVLYLGWIKSYHTFRPFKVNVNNSLSPLLSVVSGVSQACVLGGILFILYITHLSLIVSDCSICYHLYAADTQLYISFSTSCFDANIRCLEATISKVSYCMASNLLSCNLQRLHEFLLTGLPKQLSKICDPVLMHVASDNIPYHLYLYCISVSSLILINMSVSDHLDLCLP